jgi:hypothetical protein
MRPRRKVFRADWVIYQLRHRGGRVKPVGVLPKVNPSGLGLSFQLSFLHFFFGDEDIFFPSDADVNKRFVSETRASRPNENIYEKVLLNYFKMKRFMVARNLIWNLKVYMSSGLPYFIDEKISARTITCINRSF